MKSPFWQNLQETLRGLHGRSLVMVGIIWVVLLALGALCAVSGTSLFTPAESAKVAPVTSTAVAPQAGVGALAPGLHRLP
ncbi:MAG TPA: hypothetical protein P5211_03010, partial [Anaerolineae bacterium]|nr:hypothetical protein [Anaerolineae bacterium]